MTIAAINTSGAGSAVLARAPSVVAPPSISAAAPLSTSTATGSTDATRLVSDPSARVIISQLVDSQDDVVAQSPSRAVVAYLENGLTAEGFPKQSQQA